MCIASNASGLSAGTVTTKSYDVSKSASNVGIGNAGGQDGYTLYDDANINYSDSYERFYYYTNVGTLLTTSSKYYAYKISINTSDTSRTGSCINWQRYCIGSYDEVYSANARLAQLTNYNGTTTLWYVTDFSSGQGLYFGFLTYGYSHTVANDAGSSGTSIKTYFCSWNTSGHVEITITPYSEAGYMQEIANNTTETNNKLDESNQIAGETKETTKGIFSSITEFFGSFFQNLIDSVIGLFVPSSDEMSGLFDQLNQFFSDRFGFLYAPFDYMIQLLGVFTSAEGSTGLTFPGFSIMGYEVWPDLTYDLASDELVGTILDYVRIGTGILLGGWFIMYLQDFFKERFSQ